MVIWPQVFAGRSQRHHARRLAEIRDGGAEQFFEERRAIETYPPISKPRLWRTLGGLLVLVVLGRMALMG